MTSSIAFAQPILAGAPELSPAEIALACAPPAEVKGPSRDTLRLVSVQDPVQRGIFANGDLLIVSGGASAGLQLGQEYFVRHAGRSIMDMGYAGPASTAIHTAGWIRIVAVNETMAIAYVDNICREMQAGDYLEPYVAPAVLPVEVTVASGEEDFRSAGRVMSAATDRQIAAPGDYVLIDRGSDQGVARSMRFAIYRDIGPKGAPLTPIGEAVVISTTKDRALTAILKARDAVMTGDYVVPRK